MRSSVLVHEVHRSGLLALVAATVMTLIALTLAPVSVSAATLGLETAVSIDPRVGSIAAETGQVDVIVRVLPGAEVDAGELITSSGGTVDRYLPVADSLSATLTPEVLEALENRPDLVVGVTLDGPVRVLHDATDGDYYSDSTFEYTVGADELHGSGVDGSGVGVAMIDTGVNEVADLEGRVVQGIDLSGEDDGVDRFGHGTFVAGVIAGDGASSSGIYDGVAPGAHLVSIKIAGEDGSSDVSELLAALQWVVSFKDAYDIEVLNLAIGTDSTQSWTIDPVNYAVQRAWDAGIVVVVAAGNVGPDSGTILKPADDPYVITAGASDGMSTISRGDDVVPDFSSRGPTADGIAKPDLVAPGSHLIGLRAPGSTVDELAPYARVGEHYFRGSGTSFSAGVVSGAAALLKQAHSDWTPDQVKGALLGTAATGPVEDPHVDGHGALDVAAAAALTEPALANQDLASSTGDGGMKASRGSFVVEVVHSNGVEELLDGTKSKAATGKSFDQTQFLGTNWQGTNWQDSQWAGTNWQGTNWQGTNWQGTNWQGTNWQGTNWQGTNWQ